MSDALRSVKNRVMPLLSFFFYDNKFYFRWPIRRVKVHRVKMRLTVNREIDVLFR